MPKVHWLDVPRTSTHRLLVADLLVGEADSMISPALKDGLNLVLRACSALRLEGRYAVQGSRASGLKVEMIFEFAGDADRFAAAAAMPIPSDHARLVIDAATAARLEAIGGPPDVRGRGRRKREKIADQAAALGWAQRPFGRKDAQRSDF
jgi:hypothetical protein